LPYKKVAVYRLHLASLVALCYAYGSDGRFYPTKGGASFDIIVHTLPLDFEDIYVTVACLVQLSAMPYHVSNSSFSSPRIAFKRSKCFIIFLGHLFIIIGDKLIPIAA
jgi:hypothetical protein